MVFFTLGVPIEALLLRECVEMFIFWIKCLKSRPNLRNGTPSVKIFFWDQSIL